MIVDVVLDVVCPWCFIGKRRLERALKARPNIPVELRWRPFLLNPEIPPEGIDRSAYLLKKFGSETRVRRVYGAIADAGLTVEIDFDFDRIDKTPNTVNAHRFLLFAASQGRATEVVETLFQAYFYQGLDTGREDVLFNLGLDMGFDGDALERQLWSTENTDQVYEENARAHRLGINGVPAFVFNDEIVITGAQEPEVLTRVLDVAAQLGDEPRKL